MQIAEIRLEVKCSSKVQDGAAAEKGPKFEDSEIGAAYDRIKRSSKVHWF